MDENSYYLLAVYKNSIQVHGETFKLKDAVLTEFNEGLTLKVNEEEDPDLLILTPDSLTVYDSKFQVKKLLELQLESIALSPDSKYLAAINTN